MELRTCGGELVRPVSSIAACNASPGLPFCPSETAKKPSRQGSTPPRLGSKRRTPRLRHPSAVLRRWSCWVGPWKTACSSAGSGCPRRAACPGLRRFSFFWGGRGGGLFCFWERGGGADARAFLPWPLEGFPLKAGQKGCSFLAQSRRFDLLVFRGQVDHKNWSIAFSALAALGKQGFIYAFKPAPKGSNG